MGIIPQHLDLIILGYFTDFSTVGVFRIAKRLVEPINYIITILNANGSNLNFMIQRKIYFLFFKI